jgi:transcriptional regulator with XRE-family HTH domain
MRIMSGVTPVRTRLRELRDKHGLSQQALADAADVRQATVSDLESGKARRIAFDVLDRLARALRVEPGELIERARRGSDR